MAISDPYATPTQYRDSVGKSDSGEDSEIESDLKAVARWMDRRLGQFFTQDATLQTRLYAGSGKRRLDLYQHECPGIADLTGLVVKVDLNGDYDFADSNETLSVDTHFWADWEAAFGPEPRPYRFIELIPTNSVLTVWPIQARAVSVTAKFGWPAIPKAIEQANIELTGILRLESPRATSRIAEGFDAVIATSRVGQKIVQDLMEQYRTGVLV